MKTKLFIAAIIIFNSFNLNRRIRFCFTTIVLLSLVFITGLTTAQEKWYKYPGNPVFQAGKEGDWDENLFDFDILFENNEYHMWYLGYGKDNPNKNIFGFASSPDGISWEKYAGNPLMFNSDSIGWVNNFGTFDVIRKDSLYLMWYTADPADSNRSAAIGFAWSRDGLTWKSHPESILRSGESDAWDGHGVANPTVFFDGQIYHMWFSGWANSIPKIINTGYASSNDGINWKKHHSNPVMTIGEPGSWDDQWAVGYSVTFNGSLFEMWYFGWNLIKFEIGMATSRDGIRWKKSPENPLLKTGELGAWDAILIAPRVLKQDSVYNMWYCGLYNIRGAYGYATISQTEDENWRKANIESQQRLIRVQVFNRLEYINVDSLSQILQELSGTELIDACNKLALAWSLNDEAKSYEYAEKAFELAKKEDYSKGRAMALYSMGNSQYVLNNYSAALANQLTALRLFDSLAMLHEEGNLLSQIASIHTYAGSHDLACKYYQHSLDVFSTRKDTNCMLNTLNYLGEASLDAGDTIRAMEIFQNELLLAKVFKQANAEGFAYEGLGRCFQGQSLDSSIYYFTKARVIWKNKSHLMAAINSLLMAETYLASGPEYGKEAEESLQQSLNLLLFTVGEGQHQLRWCYRMAEMNMAAKKYDKAKEYLDLSLEMCRTFLSKQDQQQHISLNHKLELGVLLKEYMEKIYRLYHNLDLVLQDKDGALQHFMLATAWGDSVSNDQAWKKVSMIEGQYETEKAQDHIAVLEKDNELKKLTLKKSRIYLFGLVALVLIIILVAIIFIRNRKINAQHALELERVKSEKLIEIDQLRSKFFSNISHEFRTPLTLILGPLEKILTKTSDDSERKDLNIARKYAIRLQNLINQILSISKLESGKMHLHAAETNIARLISNYLQSFESLAKQKGITLKFTSEKDKIIAFIDREKFEQILNNLLSNAFKFSGEGGEINVRIAKVDTPTFSEESGGIQTNWIGITVSDKGLGIPAEHINHVFDRFYQVERADNSYFQGTGIGLALTRELVELHSGKIEVQSEIGKGTTFTVLLPLGKNHLKPEEIVKGKPVNIQLKPPFIVPEVNLSEEVSAQEDITELDNTKPILLIVEDNADMRFYIREYFENEFHIIEAVDGVDGYEKSIEHIPDLIISDVMMPNMDGNVFCAKVKSDERTCHIPVILVTARALKESRIEGLEMGADDFITKPFDGEELKVRVDNLIRQRKKLQEHYLKDFEAPGRALTMDEKFLQKATDVAMKNLSNPEYTVEDFASDMALSRNQLHRKLRALINNSCSEFIRTIRLNYAAELLRKKTGSISEIAYDTGFNSPTYFSISFRQQFGVSPSEYQKRPHRP